MRKKNQTRIKIIRRRAKVHIFPVSNGKRCLMVVLLQFLFPSFFLSTFLVVFFFSVIFTNLKGNFIFNEIKKNFFRRYFLLFLFFIRVFAVISLNKTRNKQLKFNAQRYTEVIYVSINFYRFRRSIYKPNTTKFAPW